MATNNNSIPKRLARVPIHECKWVNLYKDKVLFPGGRIIDEHYLIEFNEDAVTVIVTNEKEEILFIQAYRYTTQSISLEIPAGGIDPGETAIEAGIREVKEETGYDIREITEIYQYYPLNGISNKKFRILQAKSVAKTHDFDTNEVKEVLWLNQEEIREKIKKQEIEDGFTLSALLLFFYLKF